MGSNEKNAYQRNWKTEKEIYHKKPRKNQNEINILKMTIKLKELPLKTEKEEDQSHFQSFVHHLKDCGWGDTSKLMILMDPTLPRSHRANGTGKIVLNCLYYEELSCSSALKNVFEEILMTIWSSCCKISISSLECSFHSKQEEILVKKVHGKTISNQIKIQKFKTAKLRNSQQYYMTAIIAENFCLPQDGLDIQHNFLVVVVLQFGL